VGVPSIFAIKKAQYGIFEAGISTINEMENWKRSFVLP
jgi:hypothetical protein